MALRQTGAGVITFITAKTKTISMAHTAASGMWDKWQGLGCNRNAESQLEPVMEHLVGRQSQRRGAQVHA